VLFHEQLAATVGELGFNFFHFIPLQALSLTFPRLSFLWNSAAYMARKCSSPGTTPSQVL